MNTSCKLNRHLSSYELRLLRNRVELASIRPPIGTSEISSRPFTHETIPVPNSRREVEYYDLVGMTSLSLKP